jgi:hypothetical protein
MKTREAIQIDIQTGFATILQSVLASGRLPSRAELEAMTSIEIPAPAFESLTALGFSRSRTYGRHLESSIRLAELCLIGLDVFELGLLFGPLATIGCYLIEGDLVNKIRPCGCGYEVERQNELCHWLIRQIKIAGGSSKLSELDWLTEFTASVKTCRLQIRSSLDDVRFFQKDMLTRNLSDVSRHRFGRLLWLGAVPLGSLDIDTFYVTELWNRGIDVTTEILMDGHETKNPTVAAIDSKKLSVDIIEQAIKKALGLKDSLNNADQPTIGLFDR